MSLTEFLEARISDDEAVAERAASFEPFSETFRKDNYGCLTVQPDRVLAECAAKRAMIYRARIWLDEPEDGTRSMQMAHACWTEALKVLALPYADRPDYRGEWLP